MATRKTNMLEQVFEMLGRILELGISWEKLYNIGLKLCIKNPLPFAKNHQVTLPFGGKFAASFRSFNNERTLKSLTSKAKDDFTEAIAEASRVAHNPELDLAGNILGNSPLHI